MNKTAIKNFAVWARKRLLADITFKAQLLAITTEGIAEPLADSTPDLQFFEVGTNQRLEVAGHEIAQRAAFVRAIRAKEQELGHYEAAFQAIIEEVAYTWFNRLIALRFMEVNAYLPSRMRILSSERTGKNEPDMVTTPFDTDLAFTPEEITQIEDYREKNQQDELFRLLFIKQCNELHELLPELFEATDDYSELLLTVSYIDSDGIIVHLVNDIPEEDFNISEGGQIEIIGWLYQYYNIEPKADIFGRAKGKKITKEEIPAATQLFTPQWIVKYMVENSVGRLYAEQTAPQMTQAEERYRHEQETAERLRWQYYIPEVKQTETLEKQLQAIREVHQQTSLTDLKVADICMGSGHILVEAFEVLLQLYIEQGYSTRDAARSILEHNLYGVDIDERAYQLAYFAVMMKARQYNRRILTLGIQPHLAYVKSSSPLSEAVLQKMGDVTGLTIRLLEESKQAAELGSLVELSLTLEEIQQIKQKLEQLQLEEEQANLVEAIEIAEVIEIITPLVKQAELLTQRYDVIVTNPPYMPVNNGSAYLNEMIKKRYPDSKSDLFAVFIERCHELLKPNGYQAMITMHSWMFLSSYEKLRSKMLDWNLMNMAHLGARAFEEIGGEVVQTTAFVLRNTCLKDYIGEYRRLIEPNTQHGKETMFLARENRYETDQSNFSKIPGAPIAYWVSDRFINSMESTIPLEEVAYSFQGIITGDNNYFLRYWYEVDSKLMYLHITSEEKDFYNGVWVPYNKGGGFRKWFGNNDYLLRWINSGRSLTRARSENKDYYFKEGVTWSFITSGPFSARYFEKGALWDVAGSSIFSTGKLDIRYICGLMNSSVAQFFFDITNPTINYQVMNIVALPYLKNYLQSQVISLVDANISLSREDWDSFETSWDFKRHPLVSYGASSVEAAYVKWEEECLTRFNQLKANEEELNRIFIDIYGLQDELTPEVADKDVTVRLAERTRDVKSLLSYAVGCMLGRYSLDVEGLAYAGGDFDWTQYTSFQPDADNCIPITDEEYFPDDVVGLLCRWLTVVYGEASLESNLTFIADSLGTKGVTSREKIRAYFVKDFIKDHIQVYKKRPIYWQFDSGKQNGFKTLVYVHRWNADTIGNMRVEYLHPMQGVYERELAQMQEIINHSELPTEVTRATKRTEKIQKQLKETRDYDAKVAHLALKRIALDLDDGVKVNYTKIQDFNGKDGEILYKMKL